MTTHANKAKEVIANAVAAEHNSGKLELQTSADAKVAELTFGATAFGASTTGGLITANAITTDTNAAGGVIAKARTKKADGTTELLLLSATAVGGGGDVEVTSTDIAATEHVSCDSFTYQAP